MRYPIISFLLVVSLILLPVSAQDATVWGPGEDYEIDYLHSGSTDLNGSIIETFENQPTTEFTISNVTENGYSYEYIGYKGMVSYHTIRMQTFSLPGFGSLDFPTGGLPVALPLSYGDSDDWLEKFGNQIKALAAQEGQMQQSNTNLSATLEEDNLIIETETEFNESIDQSIFINLPEDNPGLNDSSYENGTIYSKINYKRSTGVIFSLDFQLTANHTYHQNGTDMGKVVSTQKLDFVAIIPPSTILNEISMSVLTVFSAAILIPIIRKFT